MYTQAASTREPRARQGSERCTDARHGRHAFSAARAVRFAAAATDGQSRRAGTEHFGSRPDLRDAGLARLPGRHPRSGAASRDLCGLPGPVPRAPAARGSTEAPQRLLQAPWSGWPSPPRTTQRPSTRGSAGRCGVICSEGGGNTSWMDGLEPPPCWSHRLATWSQNCSVSAGTCRRRVCRHEDPRPGHHGGPPTRGRQRADLRRCQAAASLGPRLAGAPRELPALAPRAET